MKLHQLIIIKITGSLIQTKELTVKICSSGKEGQCVFDK